MSLQEGDTPIMTLDGTELAGRVFTTPEDILNEKSDNMAQSHGSHCAATAAGSTFDCAGGMASEADLILCAYTNTDKDNIDDQIGFEGYNVMQSILYNHHRRVMGDQDFDYEHQWRNTNAPGG
jgi:hypothetical protein